MIYVPMTAAMYPEISQNEVSEIKTRIQAILFSIDEGIVMTEFNGDISIINDSAKRMLGITQKFPYEQKFLDYITDKDVRQKLTKILASSAENVIDELYV